MSGSKYTLGVGAMINEIVNNLSKTEIEIIINALVQYRGDDYYRALDRFKNFTQEKMQEQWGESGKTCEEILNGYKDFHEKVDITIYKIKSLQEYIE